jgi:hypothetical protein
LVPRPSRALTTTDSLTGQQIVSPLMSPSDSPSWVKDLPEDWRATAMDDQKHSNRAAGLAWERRAMVSSVTPRCSLAIGTLIETPCRYR